MSTAGCSQLWLGIESFSSDIVSRAAKYENSEIAVEAIEVCAKSGVEPSAFLMIGLPGETVDTLNHTLEVLHTVKVPYTRSIIVATPRFGTEYYRLAEAQYPWLGDSFYRLNAVRGLVANSLTPCLIQDTIDVLRGRGFLYADTPPRVGSS